MMGVGTQEGGGTWVWDTEEDMGYGTRGVGHRVWGHGKRGGTRKHQGSQQ